MTRRQLGELLVDQGVLSPGNLEQALQMQVAAGGRLGTVLIELRMVSIDDVGRALAAQYGVSEASYKMLEQAREAIGIVPTALIKKYGVVPLKLEGKRLQLAMRDPQDIAATDEISFAAGARIDPCAAAELRVFYYMERHYDIPRLARYLRVPESMVREGAERRRYLQPPPELLAPASADQGFYQSTYAEELSSEPDGLAVTPLAGDLYDVASEPAPQPTDEPSSGPPPVAEAADEFELVYLDEFEVDVVFDDEQPAVDERIESAEEEPPPDEQPDDVGTRILCANCGTIYSATPPLLWTLCPECGHSDDGEAWALPALEKPKADVDRDFALLANDKLKQACDIVGEAQNREEVLRALVSQPAVGCRSSVLFSVRQQLAVGVAARGIATTGLALQTLIVPLTAPSLLQRCFSERTALRGDFASDPMLTMISGYLGGISAKEALVAPLVLGERVFNLLCCASAPNKPFGPGAEMDIDILISAAEARLIALMKKES